MSRYEAFQDRQQRRARRRPSAATQPVLPDAWRTGSNTEASPIANNEDISPVASPQHPDDEQEHVRECLCLALLYECPLCLALLYVADSTLTRRHPPLPPLSPVPSLCLCVPSVRVNPFVRIVEDGGMNASIGSLGLKVGGRAGPLHSTSPALSCAQLA